MMHFGMDSLESNQELKFLAATLGQLELHMLTKGMSTFSSCYSVTIIRNSVLLSFNLGLSINIFGQMSDMQFSMLFKTYSESQADEFFTVSKTILMYSVNNSGPRQEPWGTPHSIPNFSESII